MILDLVLDSYPAFRLDFGCCLDLLAVIYSQARVYTGILIDFCQILEFWFGFFSFLIKFMILNRLDFGCCLDLLAVIKSRLVFWARTWSKVWDFVRFWSFDLVFSVFLIKFMILNLVLDSYPAFRLDFGCCLDLLAVVYSQARVQTGIFIDFCQILEFWFSFSVFWSNSWF